MENNLNELLLSTKLKIPEPRKNYVIRRSLFEKLSQCADMGVIFVCGGAGTGKTTLLSSFIRESGLKNACWLSLSPSNANVYSFWQYFTAALSGFWDDGGSYLELIRSNPGGAHMEHLLTLLINRLCGRDDYYMVLDDAHCIKDAALIRTLDFFLRSMPENFHLFMLSREEPPVYLGSLAMSGRLLYIDGKQMKLTPEEGISFLKNTLGLRESDEKLGMLTDYTEGWIGGLQLAAAAGAASVEDGYMLRAGGGIAAEYLTREVIASLAPESRDFLLKTSVLSYFDAEICSALFGGFTKNDFSRIIEGLIQRNLFIVCIDEKAGIYRYHNILSDYLGQKFRLMPEDVRRELYRRAANALETRGDIDEALRLFALLEDYDEILRIARSMDGRMDAWSYLDKVPTELIMRDADLAAQCFIYNLGNLSMDRCRTLYNEFKNRFDGTDAFKIVQFMESYVNLDGKVVQNYRALTAEQIESFHFTHGSKAIILVENAYAQIAEMRYGEAEESVKRALKISEGGNVSVNFLARNQLAQIYEEVGRLNDSLSCYERAQSQMSAPGLMPGVWINYYFGLVGVYMRRMELSKAGETLDEAEALMEANDIHMDISNMTLLYHRAEMKFLTGEDEAGAALVEGICQSYPMFSILTMSRLINELACAKKLPPERARQFVSEVETTEGYASQPFMRLLRARLIIEDGRLEEGLGETDEVLTQARRLGGSLHLVEAGLQKIYALLLMGRDNECREIMNLLLEAVHYACADRILMPFFIERRTILPYLKSACGETAGKNAMPAGETSFLREILAVCEGPGRVEKQPDALSARELEVLGELSQGLTNREIAERLCISQATVKTHVLSIFGKLGVSSRLLAVRAARERNLIR